MAYALVPADIPSPTSHPPPIKRPANSARSLHTGSNIRCGLQTRSLCRCWAAGLIMFNESELVTTLGLPYSLRTSNQASPVRSLPGRHYTLVVVKHLADSNCPPLSQPPPSTDLPCWPPPPSSPSRYLTRIQIVFNLSPPTSPSGSIHSCQQSSIIFF
ncbi:hypothetical protein PGT21_004254 [Puccinia graminis f. sp. tritici]|uniref:Uncharacterized protein n=1 Tax=Puccinia graminis f. sp. tritici TaxID=56615 RepID=A0A5B0NMB0_PUCGR|nr:hypothetical protein PGT21_004254 [Puccinia graminis f. sp. tritici]